MCPHPGKHPVQDASTALPNAPIRKSHSLAIERITLLWAFTECGLGGLLHAFQSPFTGLVVGGLAVIYLGYISHLVTDGLSPSGIGKRFRVLLKTFGPVLVTVITVKALVSPHTPPTAYLAVFVQTVLGCIVYSLFPFRVGALVHGTLATGWSAIQKLIVLWVLFGNQLVIAWNKFVEDISLRSAIPDGLSSWASSHAIAGYFVGLYVVFGFITGWFTGKIPSLIEARKEEFKKTLNELATIRAASTPEVKARKFPSIMPVLIAMGALWVTWTMLGSQAALHQFIRVVVILAIWTFIVKPLFHYFIIHRTKLGNMPIIGDAQRLNEQLSIYLKIAQLSWKDAKRHGRGAAEYFVLSLMYLAIHHGENHPDGNCTHG